MNAPRVFAALALSTLILSAETDYRFAFPQSEILLGLDIKWLLKSPFGTSLRGELKDSMGDLKPLETLLDQIETVHLSAVSKSGKQSDVLFLVQGKFDQAKIVELGLKNGMKLEQWGKTKVLVQPKAKPAAPSRRQTAQFKAVQFKMDMPAAASKPLFALYDAHNIVIGEEGPVRVALERMESGLTPQANPLFERARNLEASNDIWLIGNTAPLNLPASSGKNADPMTQMASQIRNFSVGVAVRRNVALDLQLQATSPKAAAQMLDMLKGVVAMAKLNSGDKAAEPFPIDLDKALEMSASGSIVRASLNVEQGELEKLMVARATPPGKPATPAPVQVAVAPPPPPKPVEPVAPIVPVRKTVMIYGLPGGPKEIPVN